MINKLLLVFIALQCCDIEGKDIKIFEKYDDTSFGFASYFQENMVLQMKPHSSILWGYGTIGAIVNVSLVQDVYSTKVVEGPDKRGIWKVVLKPQPAGGPHSFQAVQDNHGLLNWILLKDILFGDVWLCSGQSNMQFTVSMAANASEELNATSKYSNIRVMTPARIKSDIPLHDFQEIEQPWSIASPDSIGGPAWTYFSAVCWFYGKYLYDKLDVPIGLISSSWNGSPVECWSSQRALDECGIGAMYNRDARENYPIKNSVLWNAMISPLLNMTIKGAIWYQGEANYNYHNVEYSCSFPAMVQDWRKAWFDGSQQQTDPQFPFGFVQISSVYTTDDGSFPSIRWHQTADYGSVPNVKLPNTFMAVAMDLGDRASPYGSIHPRYKQDVAYRLVLGALNVAYKQSVNFQGPVPVSATVVNQTSVVLMYESATDLKVKKKGNFEVCCSSSVCDYAQPFNTSGWLAVPILSHTRKSVSIDVESCLKNGGKATTIRYAWQLYPCDLKQCSIYSSDGLPAPPYVLLVDYLFDFYAFSF